MDSILIIGGNGFLGSHLATRAGLLGMRVSVVGTAQFAAVPDAAYFRADIGDVDAMQTVFQTVSPRYVVNAAAIADIDYAEQHPKEALRVNALGAEICGKLATQYRARHLFFSSDAVFDGEKAAYSEDDATGPCNYYGKTKELAERMVAAADPDAVIARVSLLLGRSNGNSGVVDPIRRRLEAGDVAFSNSDQIRTPIDIDTLADATFELLTKQDYSGLIHLACTEAASKLEICRDIARKLGYDPEHVQPYPGESARGAARHRNGVLCVDKAVRVLKQTRMPTLAGTIARAMGAK